MDAFLNLMPISWWLASAAVAFVAGFVKGIVGFAMPLVMVSGLGAFLSPELALAGLVFPAVVSNFQQAFRGGINPVRKTVRRFRWFLISCSLFLFIGAQFVPIFPVQVYYLIVGIPVIAFVISQLLGWTPSRIAQSRNSDIGLGAIAGIFGGLGGFWGPPTVAYLTALGTQKALQMQVQGVVYFAGSLLLIVAHVASGILTYVTCAFSTVLIGPALLGMAAGTAIQDRIDQTAFRRATLIVLLIAGANLVRRGLFS